VLKLETFGKVDHKYPVSFEMWCSRRMAKISWTDRARNEEVLNGVKVERNVLHTVKRRKANWIRYILCKNCLLEHVSEGKIEENRRRARKSRQVLGDLKDKTGYYKLKDGARNRTEWKTPYEPAVRQTTE